MPKKLFITINILALLTFVILVMIIVRFSGQEPSNINVNPSAECNYDEDCVQGGCSGEICHPLSETPVVSTCIWQDEYACYAYSNCLCVEGECQWQETAPFLKCLKEVENSLENLEKSFPDLPDDYVPLQE